MSVLLVPQPKKGEPEYPTLGPLVVEFLTGLRADGSPSDRWPGSVFGPGDLKGQPYRMDAEKIGATYAAYELLPPGHRFAGRRRFKRVGLSWRKGTAKTEWAAQICYAELHPDSPVRFNGWVTNAAGDLVLDDNGLPIPMGKPVNDPYIPMVAFSAEQAEELAYGALLTIVTEGSDADYFDAGLDRIIRLGDRGQADGRAVPLAGSPNSSDGARTTFQHFDETHRLELPRLVAAYETMQGNIPKRVLADAWSLETTTAGRPGAGSVAEKTHREAQAIAKGEITDPDLFYFHREAAPHHNLKSMKGRIDAISEATGPAGEYGPGQFESIAKQWDRPGADSSYLERVWLNRWTRSDNQAFDVKKFEALSEGRLGQRIKDGAFITVGFDGARFRDSTGLVATEIATGFQMSLGLWERPLGDDEDSGWEVPVEEVYAVVEDTFERFNVWQFYGDPPHWVEDMAKWAQKRPDKVTEWWTNRRKPMGEAVRAYAEAIDGGGLSHNGDPDLLRHVGNAGRVDTRLVDDEGKKIHILGKIRPEAKFDLCMAAVLSWRARLDALAKGATGGADAFVPYRIR